MKETSTQSDLNAGRIARIHNALSDAFNPIELQITDDSHLHAGHAGAKDGLGHFSLRIVAAAFANQPRVRCHQMIYAALGDMMKTDIHALSIQASATP